MRRDTALESIATAQRALDTEDVDDLEEAPDNKLEAVEEEVFGQATAARTIAELKGKQCTAQSPVFLLRRVALGWPFLKNLIADRSSPFLLLV